MWEAFYTPARPGTYLLNVTWAGRLVKECPLKVIVEPPSNATKVVCSGEGLRAGTMGKEIKCVIDTRAAGHDELTIKCEVMMMMIMKIMIIIMMRINDDDNNDDDAGTQREEGAERAQ